MTGSTLAQMREALELTQQELANILRVSALLVFAWEHNQQPIPAVVQRTVTRFHRHGLGCFRPF